MTKLQKVLGKLSQEDKDIIEHELLFARSSIHDAEIRLSKMLSALDDIDRKAISDELNLGYAITRKAIDDELFKKMGA